MPQSSLYLVFYDQSNKVQYRHGSCKSQKGKNLNIAFAIGKM